MLKFSSSVFKLVQTDIKRAVVFPYVVLIKSRQSSQYSRCFSYEPKVKGNKFMRQGSSFHCGVIEPRPVS